ncbi:MAG: prepilin-type N-terminal cleavage/methylation domain-containing protein [Elusimicrobiaceae bacterium]|nr:prepilin-type N-terminal cleavage/methylation domain-containing protein [Elusimicrobiaceae bacterium]
MKNGFTLIELLVVVLIIGILSAVALPQYEQAVLKARYTQMQTIISAYKTAAEAYYMANGAYPQYWHDMDLEPPSGCTANDTAIEGRLSCTKKEFNIDLYDGANKSLAGFYHPSNRLKVVYVQYLDVSAHPGRRECWAIDGNDKAQNFCRSLRGQENGKATNSSCTSAGGCTTYILP